MSELRVEGLCCSFGDIRALDGMAFDVAEAEFFCLLGPSSSGKTTTLRAVAGLEALDSGRVCLDGRDITQAPVQGRGMAMIFQTFALYPHLKVEINLGYPLRRLGLDSSEIRRRVNEVSELLRITHTLQRKPSTLSGGEQQRVAIGRAIIGRPRLLLLDEPLTNLDAKLRHDMRAEFKRLHRELGMTMLYATPDQLEALTMGQRIGVVRDGRVVATGTPQQLYLRPDDTYVAGMVGSPPINLVASATDGCGALQLPMTGRRFAAGGIGSGRELVLGIRPQDLVLSGDLRREEHGFEARIVLTEPLGDVTVMDIEARDSRLKMVLREETAARYRVGQDIGIGFDPQDVHVFDHATGARMGDLATLVN